MPDESGELIVVESGGLPVKPNVAAAERYKALVEFAKDNFEFGIHYDVAPGEYVPDGMSKEEIIASKKIKKCMNQPGAEMLAAAWGLHPEFEIIEQISTDELVSYTINCFLKDRSGVIHGFAVGTAGTFETKYKYRWLSAKQIQADPHLTRIVDLDTCRRRGDGNYVKYQIPNLELGDLSPTLIMMAQKRAFVKATRTTFAISALFQQPLEDLAAALADKMEREAETKNEPASAHSASKDESKVSRAVGQLRMMFDNRCKVLNITGKKKQEAQAKLFGDCNIYGWKDVISEEIENAVQAWIDERMVPPEVEGEQPGLLD